RTRSTRRPSRSSCGDPALARRSDDDAIVLQSFRLELETRQAAILDATTAEAEALVGLGERLGELADDAIRIYPLPFWDLDQHLDFILAPIRGIEMDTELVDFLELPDDRLDGARINIGPPHQLHVVDPPADTNLVEVEGARAGADVGRDRHVQIEGRVSEVRTEAAYAGGAPTPYV